MIPSGSLMSAITACGIASKALASLALKHGGAAGAALLSLRTSITPGKFRSVATMNLARDGAPKSSTWLGSGQAWGRHYIMQGETLVASLRSKHFKSPFETIHLVEQSPVESLKVKAKEVVGQIQEASEQFVISAKKGLENLKEQATDKYVEGQTKYQGNTGVVKQGLEAMKKPEPGKPGGKPPAKPNDKPGGQPAGKPGGQPAGKPGGQPAGKPGPGDKPPGNPGEKPQPGKPGGQPAGKPGPGDKPPGNPGEKPQPGKPGGQPVGKPGPGDKPPGNPGGKPQPGKPGKPK